METRKKAKLNYDENFLFGTDAEWAKKIEKPRLSSKAMWNKSSTPKDFKIETEREHQSENASEIAEPETNIKQEHFEEFYQTEENDSRSDSHESINDSFRECETCVIGGVEALQLQGYLFLKSFWSGTIYFWECNEKIKENCNSCVITSFDVITQKHFLKKFNQQHSHGLLGNSFHDNSGLNNILKIEPDDDIHTRFTIDIGDKCEFIKYIQGYLKIFINGNTYFSNKICENIFYWQCDEDKDCISQAITVLDSGQHFLKSLDEHNHSTILTNVLTKEDFLSNCYENSHEKCEFHVTSKSELKLYRNGYYYIKFKKKNEVYFWKCNDNTLCPGLLITQLINDEHYVKSFSEHNHQNCINSIDFNKIIEAPNNNSNNITNNYGIDNSDNCDSNNDDFDSDNDNDNNSFSGDHVDDLLPVPVNKIKSEKNDSDFDNSDLDNLDSIKKELDNQFVKEIEGDVICKFTVTNRGNPKLCVNGYFYTKNRSSSTSYYWTCEHKKNKNCYGYVCTEFRDGNHYLRRQREHSHPPHFNRIHYMNLMERIKQRITNEPDATAKVIATEEYEKTPKEYRHEVPPLDKIIKLTQRKRRYEHECSYGRPDSKDYRPPTKKLKLEINNGIVDGIICELVESQRGNSKLIAENYLYTLNRVSGDCFSWRCEERGKTTSNCQSSCTTQLISGIHYLKCIREHSHEPSVNRQIIVKTLTTMKEKSLLSNDPASEIIKSELSRIQEEEILKEFPKDASLVRMLNRYRALNGHSIRKEEIKKEPGDNDEDHFFDINMMIGSECDLFAPTNKGNLKLNLNGYYYHKNRIKNNLHYWQCEENRTLMCKGFAITICNEDNRHFLKSFKCHNHTPKELRGDVIAIVEKIKEKARSTDEDASIIWNDEVAILPDELKTLMPQRAAIMNMINRIRRPIIPKQEIEFDDDHEHIFSINQLAETECEFVKSTKGNDKLTIEGYLFVRNKVFNHVWRWRCDENKKQEKGNCRGYAITEFKEGKHILKKAQNHNHPANAYRIEIANAVNRMKERARQDENLPAAKIFEDETSDLPEEVKKLLPSLDAISSLIRRHRRKFYEPQSIQPKQSKLGPIENHVHEPFVEPGSEVEIITCHKGTIKLNLNGYLFVKNSVKNNVHYWRCEEKHCSHCRGHATTIEEVGGKHYLRTTQPHNHLAKVGDQKEINNVLNRVKELALLSNDGPAKIYSQIVNNLSKDLKAVLPSRDAITMIIKRHRKKYRPIDRSAIAPQKVYPPEVVVIIDRMKEKILKTKDGPAKIYNAEIANVPFEVRDKFPKRENVLQALKRVRRKSRLRALKSGEIVQGETFNESDDDDDSDLDDEEANQGKPIGHIFKRENIDVSSQNASSSPQNSSSSQYVLPAQAILHSSQIMSATHFLSTSAPPNGLNFWEHSKNFQANP